MMLKQLYEQDESLWRDQMIQLLEENRLTEIDATNLTLMLIEMGKSEQRSVKGSLTELIMHYLKSLYQPEMATRSWYVSILKQRRALLDLFEDSPSLLNIAKNNFNICYKNARKFAVAETGLSYSEIPEEPTFDFDFIISENYPDSLKKFGNR